MILSIEGIPLITRFKTLKTYMDMRETVVKSIEGIPLITRFKTATTILWSYSK